MERLVWTPSEVVDVDGPRAMLRAYLEQRDVRTLLATRHRGRVPAACDIGCGFGRLTSLLGEFADTVVGFEREPGLVATARALMPAVYVRWLSPWRLAAAKPRVIEPDYPRPDVGSYMLFVGPDAEWTGVPSR